MNDQNKSYDLKPRNLGSEWENWNEKIGICSNQINTTPTLFLTLLTFVASLGIGLVTVIYYILSFQYPQQFQFLYWLYMGVLILIFLSYTLFMFTIWFKRPFAFFLKDKQFANSMINKFTLIIGRRLGFSNDKLLNSMLQVGNILTRTLYSPVEKDELLVLIPRCLSKTVRQELQQMTDEREISCRIAAGGSEARDILKDRKPKGIIAVACERDLFAGVSDVPPQIPVIAIANSRPDGPCRNTTIDLVQLKDAIDFFDTSKT